MSSSINYEDDRKRILEIESAIEIHNLEVIKKCNHQDFDDTVVLSPALKKRKLIQLKKLKLAILGKSSTKKPSFKGNRPSSNGPKLLPKVEELEEKYSENNKTENNKNEVKIQLSFPQDSGVTCTRCLQIGHKKRRCIQRPLL